jgi:hypothetical protein
MERGCGRLEQHVGDRLALLNEIEQSWTRQAPAQATFDVEAWIGQGAVRAVVDPAPYMSSLRGAVH